MSLPPHGPPEITEAQQAATSLGEVEDPTPDNVSRALQDYSPYAVASAAAALGASGGGGGGSQPGTVTLLGPFTVDFDTPGFFNPESGNGVETLDIPAGSFVRAFAIVTASFAGSAADDYVQLQLLLNTNSSGISLAQYSREGLNADQPSIAFGEPPSQVTGSPTHTNASAAVAVDDCSIVAVYWPAGATTITAGSLDVYALVATPAV